MVTFLVGSDVSVSDLYDMEWGEAWEQGVYLGGPFNLCATSLCMRMHVCELIFCGGQGSNWIRRVVLLVRMLSNELPFLCGLCRRYSVGSASVRRV